MSDSKYNSRKFLMSLLMYLITAVMVFMKIDIPEVYKIVTIGILLIYVLGNVGQKFLFDLKSGVVTVEPVVEKK